jgi:hypothetical protein
MGSDGSTIGDDPLSQRLGDQNNPIEESDTPIHRAGPGEGVRAPLAQEGADHAEYSIFDGKGNEQVVVVADNKHGKPVQATGDSSEEAASKVEDQEIQLSPAFDTPPFNK